MGTAYRIIPFNDRYRVRVEYDHSPENPRKDWDWITGALSVNIDSRRSEVTPAHTFPGYLGGAWNAHRDEVFVIRWARIFYDITVVYDEGTFWWVDPGQFSWQQAGARDGVPLYSWDASGTLLTKAEIETKVIQQDIETYQQWVDGNVYGVIVEHLEHWENPETGAVRDTWEEVASVWGFYLDEDGDEDDQFLRFAIDMYGMGEKA